jgi:hypothetical protein
MKITILIVAASLTLAPTLGHADEALSATSFDWEWRLVQPTTPRDHDSVKEWMLNTGRITQSQFDSMKRNDAEQDQRLQGRSSSSVPSSLTSRTSSAK